MNRRKAQFEDDVEHTRAELEGLDEAELEAAEERLEEIEEEKKKGKKAVRFRA